VEHNITFWWTSIFYWICLFIFCCKTEVNCKNMPIRNSACGDPGSFPVHSMRYMVNSVAMGCFLEHFSFPVNYTRQQDFGTWEVYCVSNVTFHAKFTYAIKIFPSPTVFAQWLFYYWFFGILGIFFSDFLICELIF
jgi:hypothetical protein